MTWADLHLKRKTFDVPRSRVIKCITTRNLRASCENRGGRFAPCTCRELFLYYANRIEHERNLNEEEEDDYEQGEKLGLNHFTGTSAQIVDPL